MQMRKVIIKGEYPINMFNIQSSGGLDIQNSTRGSRGQIYDAYVLFI